MININIVHMIFKGILLLRLTSSSNLQFDKLLILYSMIRTAPNTLAVNHIFKQ